MVVVGTRSIAAKGKNEEEGEEATFNLSAAAEADFDHSPQSNAEFKNEWRCVSTPLICLHGVDRRMLLF
jgi:hypothetical protein